MIRERKGFSRDAKLQDAEIAALSVFPLERVPGMLFEPFLFVLGCLNCFVRVS